MKRLFECRRYDVDDDLYWEDWAGALLIFADSEESAIEIFIKHEGMDCFGDEQYPLSIKEITKFEGVIYNDYKR